MAYLYRGGAGGLSATATTSLASPDGLGYFGTAVAGAGDVNGDGRADVMVAGPQAQSGVGQAYLYLGKTTGLPSSPSETLTGVDPAPGGFGQSLAAAQRSSASPSGPARAAPSQRGSRRASDRHRLAPARTNRRA